MPASRLSLRRQLLLGILVPVVVFVALAAASLYRSASQAASSAYDRTLLASAKAIGERLRVAGEGRDARVVADVPYSALEAFEADNRSSLYYKVLGFTQESVSGFTDLPAPRALRPGDAQPYAALVHFYDDEFRGQPVRVAVLLQPVAGPDGHGMATIQVAETLELRRTMARSLLAQTLLQQLVLVALIAAVVVYVVQRATRPVRELSVALEARDAGDLSPLPHDGALRELQPIVAATNAVMGRLARLLEHQKRFVRDASHQLRTPLAVLKVQVQSARRGDLAPPAALEEIDRTVDGATRLANQMLALAKVEQLRAQADAPVVDLDGVLRSVAIDLSALIAERGLDFSIETVAAPVRAHEWALREMTRNLLHNAIKFSAPRGLLAVRLAVAEGEVRLCIADSGPGLTAAQRERLFQPFARTPAPGDGGIDPHGGAGLGLAICDEIVRSLDGRIELDNRIEGGRIVGLAAWVRLPLADNRAS